MKPVNQQYVDSEYGDCMRACVASLLEVPIDAVPHFLLSGELWHDVEVAFMWAHGWHWIGTKGGGEDKLPLLEKESINGFFHASVQSFLYNGNSHCVVMDMNGVCVHDPSPTKAYQDRMIYGTKELSCWGMYESRNDDWITCSHVKKYIEHTKATIKL